MQVATLTPATVPSRLRKYSTMKKLIGIGAAVSGAILATCAVGVAIVAAQNRALDLQSRIFAERSMVAIVSHWNPDALIRRASTPMRAALAGGGNLAETFDSFRLLGTLRALGGVTGEARLALRSDGQMLATAEYVAEGRFEHGSARIHVTLLKDGGRWRILRFGVISPAGFNLAAQATDRRG
jgi:hypothetical protein